MRPRDKGDIVIPESKTVLKYAILYVNVCCTYIRKFYSQARIFLSPIYSQISDSGIFPNEKVEKIEENLFLLLREALLNIMVFYNLETRY